MLKAWAAIIIFGAVLGAQPVPRTFSKGGSPSGQARVSRQWWDGDISKNANLTDAQQKQILQLRRESRSRMMEVQRAVNAADADVAAAFNEEPVDQAKANEAINRLATARAELTRTISQFSLKVRTVLTAQQWQEMQQPRPWPDRSDRPGGRRRGPPTSSTSTTTNQQK